MKKPQVLIFTKTRWSEPPRLRHQVTHLLGEMGYDIVFFEKPSFFTWFKIYEKDNIKFVKHFELVHHRLRIFNVFIFLNALVSKAFIRKALKRLDVGKAPAVNFCYDYFFLKELVDGKVITIINDDFVNKIKNEFIRNKTESQISRTAKKSTYNLAVSYPLKHQLERYVDEAGLFLPWAEEQYITPVIGRKRNVVLFFGYINYRIDWDLVLGIIERGVKIRFIGPIESSVDSKLLQKVRSYTNVEFKKAMGIDQVDFSDICCSLLPWDTSLEGIRAITINNKCFNLLARGIPQLYVDLPYLIEADDKVIVRCRNVDEFVEQINFYSDNFDNCQKPIQDFLDKHYSNRRMMDLKKHLNF